MKIQRREFIAGALSLAHAAAAPQSSSSIRVALVSGPQRQKLDIVDVFSTLGLASTIMTPAEGQLADPAKHALLWIAATDYPYPMRLSGTMLKTIDAFLAAGRGVFVEFALNFPGVSAKGDLFKTEIARLFVEEPLGVGPEPVPAGTILDEHDSVCVPLVVSAPGAVEVLRFGKVRGVEKSIDNPDPTQTWPGLVAGTGKGGGRFAIASTSLSAFRQRQYAPRVHWEQFLRELVLSLLPEPDKARALASYVPCRAHTEPRVWVMPGSSYKLVVETTPGRKIQFRTPAKEVAPGRFEAALKATATGPVHLAGTVGPRAFAVDVQVADRKDAYRRALDRNIKWFEQSGVMPRPDGSLGVTEWISGPDTEGNRIPYGKGQMFAPDRSDCVFESAVAMWLYGKVTASERHRAIGMNMMRRVMDFQRLMRGDKYYGLWYTRGRSGPVYQDDTAIAILFSMAGYRWMRHPMFLERGLLAAKASLDVFAGAPPVAAGSADANWDHPHERGQMLAAWLYTSGLTGDPRYAAKAIPLVRKLVEDYPKIPRLLISRTGESAKFLLPITLAYEQTRDPFFATALREQSDYLHSRIADCGAIQEDGSNTGNRLSGTDLGLTYDNTETISDQLYTTSFAAMNFWIAYKATGDERYRENYFRVADYLVRIQIRSAHRTIDGGWMRGFDYSLWEYYGSNADQSWTAYCLETGWTNAIIDIALSLYLLDDTFYEPTHRG